MAQAEPVLWITGAGLVLCVGMIAGLLLVIVWQGGRTFWPLPVVQLQTLDQRTLCGEVTRAEKYDLTYAALASQSPPLQEAGRQLLRREFRARLAERLADAAQLAADTAAFSSSARDSLLEEIRQAAAVTGADADARRELLAAAERQLTAAEQDCRAGCMDAFASTVRQDDTGAALEALWNAGAEPRAELAAAADAESLQSLLGDAAKVQAALRSAVLTRFSQTIKAPMHRRLVRVGNVELNGDQYAWVSDFECQPGTEQTPPWVLLFERVEWRRFYGFPKSIRVDSQEAATTPQEIWRVFQQHHAAVRRQVADIERISSHDVGRVNAAMKELLLRLKRIELRHGLNSDAWRTAKAAADQEQQRLEAEAQALAQQIETIRARIAGFVLVLETAQGQSKELPLADVVRAYPANQMSWSRRIAIYLDRWREFLVDEPREANSEGGVFPAIWGTVAMTMLMTVAVVPFGVIAALYLREYASHGVVVSLVRIAVNNLAGVPSIVFGVFGLGFFCYIVGASLDRLLFAAELEISGATFGTGGLFWAAATLALLTLPVVIVATEEALAAVPRSIREGSLACGASKWQTIRRIVLPRAMPGILTGAILAMARGAGEVAPLMLVGAVKIAPELPVDGEFPFVHLQRSFMHLGFHIFDLGFQSPDSEGAKPMVFTTTLLLIAIIALMNVLAIWLRARLRRKFQYSQF